MQFAVRRSIRALAIMLPLAALLAGCDDTNNNSITGIGAQNQIIASMQSDADIMGVMHQSNLNEINEANLALSVAADTGVRAFAQRMISDHTTLDQQAAVLASQQGITPILRDSTLVLQASTETAQLRSLSGTSFDRAYIDEQITDHQQTLALVDAGIQRAQNAALRAMLQNQVRPVVATHLQMAQAIQTRIGQ